MAALKCYGLLLCCVLACLLAACAAAERGPAGGGLAGLLPAPGALRSVSSPVLVRPGREFEPLLPHDRVVASLDSAVFTPAYTGAPGGTAGLAYAIYLLGSLGDSGPARLQLELSQAGTPGQAWVALPDYSRGRWDWYLLDAPVDGSCGLDFTLDGRTLDGALPVAVAFTGAQTWKLDRLRLGRGSTASPGWDMLLHDARHSSLSAHCGPALPVLRMSWSAYSLQARNSAALCEDGSAYLGGDALVIAYRPDGSEWWRHEFTDATGYPCSPAVAPDGTVYCTGIGSTIQPDLYLYAFSAAGADKWGYKLTTGQDAYCIPVAGPDGTVYIAAPAGLLALSAAGSLLWQHAGGYQAAGNFPSVGDDGTVYICDPAAHKLQALSAGGAVAWECSLPDSAVGCPAIAADGTLYVNCQGGTLCAVSTDGMLLWDLPLDSALDSPPALGPGGRIYVAAPSGKLYAVESNSSLAWSYSAGGEFHAAPAVDANGAAYLGSSNGTLYAVRADGVLQWAQRMPAGKPLYGTPAIGGDGTLFVTTTEELLYFSADFPAQQWTCYQHDAQHTGQSSALGPATGHVDCGYQAEAAFNCAPAFGPNGMLYAGADDGLLYALSPALIVQWTSDLGAELCGAPAVAPDGRIYCLAKNGVLRGLLPDGSVFGEYNIGAGSTSAPVVSLAQANYVYAGGGSGGGALKLFMLTPDLSAGQPYSFPGGTQLSAPALGYDGSVYVACDNGKLYALSSALSYQWAKDIGADAQCAPAVGLDGTVYAGSTDGYLAALSPAGSTKWNYTTGAAVTTGLALGSGGAIYFGCADYKLYSITAAGELRWSYAGAGAMLSAPVLDAAGYVYFAAADGVVMSLSQTGELRWSYATLGPVHAGVALSQGGSLYVPGTDTYLYKFTDE